MQLKNSNTRQSSGVQGKFGILLTDGRNETMTLYEATHGKYFVANSDRTGKPIDVTAKTLIQKLIAGQPNYYRRKKENYGWIDKAKKDLEHGMRIAKNRVKELEQATRMINNIETSAAEQGN